MLDLDTPQSGLDLFTDCEGTLGLKPTTQTNTEVIKQLNATIAPNQQFTTENTKLDSPTLTTAEAVCSHAEGSSNIFWVISINKEAMTVYYEGASFLEFEAMGPH
ncbi:MAG TPA: hypothetical protein VFV43_04405 [Limnobacter sp.]|nr:hypothetical protein [Limnobacter sp.]